MSIEKRILFLGVGGAGMAPLAMWCAAKGDLIFGYDDYFKQCALDYLINSKVELLDAVLIEDIKSMIKLFIQMLLLKHIAFCERQNVLKYRV